VPDMQAAEVAVDALWNRFAYHPPDADHAERHQQWRDACADVAALAVRIVPAGREQSEAIKALEDAMMWGNAGIARHDRAGNRLRPPRSPEG
jgi:hypothetical protein